MPKRSNTFQRLAMLIHERISSDCIVEESRMFTDLVTGDQREVDIVVTSKVGPYPLYLSIECRDHARPADVTWVEGMAKKHEHLPTSKLVLWCSNGFTKAAIRKARALKIDAISQAQAARTDWANLARDLVAGHVQYVTPKFTAFMDVCGADGQPRRLDDVGGAAWFDQKDSQVGTIYALIQFIERSAKARTAVLDNATSGPGDFYCELLPPEPWFAELPDGGKAPILRIGVSIETFTERGILETASAMGGGSVVTLASAKLGAGTLEILVNESAEGKAVVQSSLRPLGS